MAKELERAQNILREFGKTLRKMPAHPAPEEVHKLRTAARRIEAIATTLPLDGSQKERRLLMAVNRLRKALGEVRDMDVLIANARELSRQVPAESLGKLVQSLERMREKGIGKLRRELDDEGARVRHQLKNFRRKIDVRDATIERSGNGRAPGPRIAVRSRAQSLARDLAHWPRQTAENIHAYRLEVKQLRYVLQFGASSKEELVAALGARSDRSANGTTGNSWAR